MTDTMKLTSIELGTAIHEAIDLLIAYGETGHDESVDEALDVLEKVLGKIPWFVLN